MGNQDSHGQLQLGGVRRSDWQQYLQSLFRCGVQCCPDLDFVHDFGYLRDGLAICSSALDYEWVSYSAGASTGKSLAWSGWSRKRSGLPDTAERRSDAGSRALSALQHNYPAIWKCGCAYWLSDDCCACLSLFW